MHNFFVTFAFFMIQVMFMFVIKFLTQKNSEHDNNVIHAHMNIGSHIKLFGKLTCVM